MSNPKLVGRQIDSGELLKRASTEPAAVGISVCRESVGGSPYYARALAFGSLDREDRGGLVIRLDARGGDGVFIPHCVSTPEGVEIHLCGEEESVTLVMALRAMLNKLPLDE